MSELSREELERWDREHVWHAFTQMAEYEPLIIERGEGCVLYDIDDRAYLDGVSSLWCNIHGHRHPRLDTALTEQVGRIAHTTLLGASNSRTIELARRLVELAPAGLSHVFFSDDGATAVEVALKMCFQYWRQRPEPRPDKRVFLAFDQAYHGDTLGSVSVGGVARFHEMFKPLLFDTIRLDTPREYRLPDGVSKETAREHFLGAVENVLRERHDEVAGVVVEPLLQAAAGMITHPPGFLRGLSELCDRYDVMLIADEVAVGFGRTGRMFACEHEDVRPDFLCLAKGITGGYLPLAATLTTTKVWNAFLGEYSESRTFYHGHTYGGNPLGAAVALASLDVFRDERVLEKLSEKIDRLAKHLSRIGELAHVGDVRQRGMIAGIELVRDRATDEPYDWAERRGGGVCEHARSEGVLVRPLGNVVVVMPPLAVSLDELDQICGAVERGIVAVTAE